MAELIFLMIECSAPPPKLNLFMLRCSSCLALRILSLSLFSLLCCLSAAISALALAGSLSLSPTA